MSYLLNKVIQIKLEIKKSKDINSLKLIHAKYLGKKGLFTNVLSKLYKLSLNNKVSIGKLINRIKQDIYKMLINRENELKRNILNMQLMIEKLDISLPGRRNFQNGGLHPLSKSISRIENFFCSLGFSVVYGSEIENDYYNFTALNIPINHPSRNEHDTFWFDSKILLRTQTSSIQVRVMNSHKPPIRIISPGRVYRNDYDQTHTPMFHQIEGLIIDSCVNFTNLKGTLYDFIYYFFEKKPQIRFRPSYFPFTKMSAEVDIMENNDSKWLEVLGCGMVHSNVLRNVNIDPNIYSGFAFGIGIERITMIYYGIDDLRLFFENDLRFLRQFK